MSSPSLRRTYLTLLGSGTLYGLAGCTDAPRTDGGTDDSGASRLTLVETDDTPSLPVEPTIEVTRATATADHPPQLRTALTNTTDAPVRVGEGRAVHFEYVVDERGDLLLLPTDPPRPYPAEAGCWRLTEGIAVTEEYRMLDVAPDEPSTRLVDCYATAGGDASGCLPTGEFRFETTITVVGDAGEQEAAATWGFRVRLD